MVARLFRAIIMGAPGSGKGTISNRIIKDFNMKHLSSGDLLRSQILNKTAAGLTAKEYMDHGKYVPDDTMVDLISAELKKMSSDSWLLDGFPRTIPQAEALYDREPVDAVLNLKVPFNVIVDRIKGRYTHLPSGRIYNTDFNPPKVPGIDDVTGEPLVQRDDDKPETVLRRLEAYQTMANPVLQFYRDHGLLQEFTGLFSNEIWPHVHEFLSLRTKPLKYTAYN